MIYDVPDVWKMLNPHLPSPWEVATRRYVEDALAIVEKPMTEAEWLACADPAAMLKAITSSAQAQLGIGPPNDRKLRLFAVACQRSHFEMAGVRDDWWRTVWHDLEDCPGVTSADYEFRYKRAWVASPDPDQAARVACLGSGDMHAERTRLTAAALLRDIFGNPWRPVVTEKAYLTDAYSNAQVAAYSHARLRQKGVIGKLKSEVKAEYHRSVAGCVLPQSVLAWNDATVPRIAQAIYDDRRFDDMPILADALEEAGCDCEELLQHCRGMQRCPTCNGAGYVALEYADGSTIKVYCQSELDDVSDPPPRQGSSSTAWRWAQGVLNQRGETRCNKTGWVPVGPHVRGCWVLDLLLGKQ